MNKIKRYLFVLCIIILCAGGGTGVYYYSHYIQAELTKYEQNETASADSRPECGWYQLYSYSLKPDTALTATERYMTTIDDDNQPFRLALLEFNLKEYAASSLDSAALENIRTVLKQFSQTNMKVILRFLYDWDGNGSETEPSSKKIIKTHMEQTANVLNEYTDTIYTTQGIFVGSWAEMHDSRYLSTADMTDLLLCFANALDDSIYLSVRTPAQYRSILKEVKQNGDSYGRYHITYAQLKKRLGIFNDGILGSLSDVGTYQTVDAADSETQKKALRKKELAFQGTVAQTAPLGGEAVTENALNDGMSAISALSAMHVSYLNQMHDTAVIDKWKNTMYTGDETIWQQSTVYDYISAHLGARFVLRDCSISYRPLQKEATGSITLENVGFSCLYHEKNFTLALKDADGNEKAVLLSSENDDDIQVCDWQPQQEIKLSFSFDPLALGEGTYYLTAVMTESNDGKSIPFANDSYDETLGGYCLGEIRIHK